MVPHKAPSFVKSPGTGVVSPPQQPAAPDPAAPPAAAPTEPAAPDTRSSGPPPLVASVDQKPLAA
eukprot:gene37642-34318_t